MKRFVILIFIALAVSIANGVTVVRNRMATGIYHVYVPADDTGLYWTRWDLTYPGTGFENYFPIQNVVHGIVRPGKIQGWEDASDSNVPWTDGGLIFTFSAGFRTNQNDWIEWDIPDDHNIVYFCTRPNSNANAAFNITVTGTDVVGLPSPTSKNLNTNFSTLNMEWTRVDIPTGTSRKFRATVAGSGTAPVLFGIHSFDEFGNGDPSTELSSNVALGHDIIAMPRQKGKTSPESTWNSVTYEKITGKSDMVMYANTLEMTIKWGILAGADPAWTGYGGHLADVAENNPFVLTAGPFLYIDGVQITGGVGGTMDEVATVPLGYIATGDAITTIADGYGDDGINGAGSALHAKITSEFTKGGLSVNDNITWIGDAQIDATDGPYVPSVLLPSASEGAVVMTGNIYALPDNTPTDLTADDFVIHSNKVTVVPDNKLFVIEASSIGPIQKVFPNSVADKSKFYFQIEVDLLNGGGTPSSGDIWALGGNISVINKASITDVIGERISRYRARYTFP